MRDWAKLPRSGALARVWSFVRNRAGDQTSNAASSVTTQGPGVAASRRDSRVAAPSAVTKGRQTIGGATGIMSRAPSSRRAACPRIRDFSSFARIPKLKQRFPALRVATIVDLAATIEIVRAARSPRSNTSSTRCHGLGENDRSAVDQPKLRRCDRE